MTDRGFHSLMFYSNIRDFDISLLANDKCSSNQLIVIDIYLAFNA